MTWYKGAPLPELPRRAEGDAEAAAGVPRKVRLDIITIIIISSTTTTITNTTTIITIITIVIIMIINIIFIIIAQKGPTRRPRSP